MPWRPRSRKASRANGTRQHRAPAPGRRGDSHPIERYSSRSARRQIALHPPASRTGPPVGAAKAIPSNGIAADRRGGKSPFTRQHRAPAPGRRGDSHPIERYSCRPARRSFPAPHFSYRHCAGLPGAAGKLQKQTARHKRRAVSPLTKSAERWQSVGRAIALQTHSFRYFLISSSRASAISLRGRFFFLI